MEFNLRKVLKALLFSTSEPLALKDVQTALTRYHQELAAELEEETGGDEQAVLDEVLAQAPALLTGSQIREALAEIQQELDDAGEVYELVEGPEGWRVTIRPQYAGWVRVLRNEPRPQRLSPAMLETLAVIAYRQPVTRAEIEAVRGVSCDRQIARLMEAELVAALGRADLPGRPIQYGATEHFLELCGLRSFEELPSSDVVSPAQLTEWIRQATQPQKEISDADVGLPEEED